MTTVPPRSDAKVVTSCDLTMSPCFSASSSLLCVGSSVRWESSRSSAMSAHEASHFRRVVVEEDRHQRSQEQHHHEEACKDVDRLGDEENLDLRHEAAQHADGDIDREAEDEERRREFQ